MDSIYLIITTVAKKEDANKLANLAIEKNMAACAQVQSQCISTYRWQGQIETVIEYPVHFKTNEANKQALMSLLKQNHPYDVLKLFVSRLMKSNQIMLNGLMHR